MQAPSRNPFFKFFPLYKNIAKFTIFEIYLLKNSVGYENLHSNSPLQLHDKKNLKM